MSTPTPFGAVRLLRLTTGQVPSDDQSMSTKILRRHAAAILRSETAVIVLDLTDGAVEIEPNPGEQIWESPIFVVLATHADALAAAKVAAGRADFLGALTDQLNASLAELVAAGEIPTPEQLAEVLAELAQIEREQAGAQIIAFPAGGAA